MPAPERQQPHQPYTLAIKPLKGIVGYYSDEEVDALLAELPGGEGDSAITVHDGAAPQPAAPVPQALEDAFEDYEDGLHFFKGAGALVTVIRQQYQTTIVINGPVKSVAKIVKSDAGLPTPQNPSYLCQQEPDGKWLKMTSDEINKPFGPPQMVDLFALTGGGADLTNYYTKPEVDGLLGPIRVDIGGLTSNQEQFLKQGDLDQTNGQIQALATVTQDVMDKLETKADKTTVNSLGTTLMNSITEVKADTYTKQEVDDKLESDKDFSIANDNVLLASITSLQEIVTNLGSEIGTGQIDVLDAIRDVEIEPSSIKFTGDAMSPIAWKGGLSLAPVKEGDNWKLGWNDGEIVSHLATQADLSGYVEKPVVTLMQSQMQILFDSIYTREEADGRYAKKSDNTQNLVVNGMVAKGYTFGDAISTSNPGLAYTDTGEGYGPRLVLDTPGGVELIPYQSDFEPIKARLNTLEGKQAPVTDLSPYVTLVAADAKYELKAAGDLLRGQLQTVFDSIYTRAESDARYYTQKQTEDRFIKIDQAFSKADFDNQMALFLYSRKQVDDKLAAINPIASPSINDPALASFKQSVLDEVKRLMSGGKTVPPDIDWTVCPSVAGAGTIEARVLNGIIQLRGDLTITISATGSFTQVRKLPANFPKPLAEYNCLVYGIQVGSTYRRVFVRWATNGDIGICPDGTMTAATLTGATAYAY